MCENNDFVIIRTRMLRLYVKVEISERDKPDISLEAFLHASE